MLFAIIYLVSVGDMGKLATAMNSKNAKTTTDRGRSQG